MANNIISQYYTKNDGMQISNDYQFSILQGNEKIINKNSGEKFVKNPSYSNVFDKTNTFTDYLNDARSTSIASIDDANTSGVCSCKNSSGTQIDTFTCHVPVSNSAPTLSWGQTSTIGTVDGTPLTVKMPANPDIDTKYSAGTGLTLSGTTFNVNIPNYKMSDGSNPDTTYIMTLDANQNACHPSGYTIEGLVNLVKSTASSSFFIRTIQSRASEGGEVGESFTQFIEKLYIPEKEKYLYTVSGLAKCGRRVPIPGINIEILSFSGTYYVGNSDINADGSGHLDIGAVDESINIRTGNLNKATGTWVAFFAHKLYDGPNGAGLSYNLKYLATSLDGSSGGTSGGTSGDTSGDTSGGTSETPTTHLKTYILSDTELNKVSSNANAFSDEEVFNFIKGKDPGAVSLVHYEREFILDEGGHQGLIRITSIKYYTTTA